MSCLFFTNLAAPVKREIWKSSELYFSDEDLIGGLGSSTFNLHLSFCPASEH